LESALDLPFVTADLPGTGGKLKLSPAHFVVEEIPLYEPSGAGEHVFLAIRREGLATREVQRLLARAFGVRESDVGCAGQKDKIARATQTFSVPARSGAAEEIAARAADQTGLEVLGARRHGRKLGRGHLLGNRFEILVAGAAPATQARADAVLARLRERGFPNFFGEQRLGPGGRSARRGRRRLEAGAGGSFIARMELSAWQSALFQDWLRERIARSAFDRVLAGDIARKEDTGGLFEVLEPQAEQPRFDRGEISTTGPIFGSRMLLAGGEPGQAELELLADSGFDAAALSAVRLPGSRRVARVFPRETSTEACPEGLRVRFRLPKGAYATIAMREITKTPA